MEEPMRKFTWLAGALALAACNTPFNNALPPGSLAGDWSGPVLSAGSNQGSIRMSLVPTSGYSGHGGNVGGWTMTGTWTLTVASAADSGTVAADGKDGSLAMHFNLHGASGCVIDLQAGQFGSTLRGTYTASGCAVPDSGNISVTKR
jgi:hypothetical protein